MGIEEHYQADAYITAIGDPTQFDEIVFCGFGEPTMRLKVLLEISHAVKKKGGMVRINTDGLANLVHKKNVLPEMAGCIDALSVSLNGQNEEVYNKHCLPGLKGSCQAVLDFLSLSSSVLCLCITESVNYNSIRNQYYHAEGITFCLLRVTDSATVAPDQMHAFDQIFASLAEDRSRLAINIRKI